MSGNPAGNYMSKVNNSNARTKCSKLYFTPCSSVSIVKVVQINTGWELPEAEKLKSFMEMQKTTILISMVYCKKLCYQKSLVVTLPLKIFYYQKLAITF